MGICGTCGWSGVGCCEIHPLDTEFEPAVVGKGDTFGIDDDPSPEDILRSERDEWKAKYDALAGVVPPTIVDVQSFLAVHDVLSHGGPPESTLDAAKRVVRERDAWRAKWENTESERSCLSRALIDIGFEIGRERDGATEVDEVRNIVANLVRSKRNVDALFREYESLIASLRAELKNLTGKA